VFYTVKLSFSVPADEVLRSAHVGCMLESRTTLVLIAVAVSVVKLWQSFAWYRHTCTQCGQQRLWRGINMGCLHSLYSIQI